MRLFKTNPLLKLVNSYVVDSPQPSNLSYWWNFGSLLAFSLIIQIITGVTLAMHYNADIIEAFNSVEHIMRDINNGWLIRYLHSNTASAFFLIVYLHIGRGLYYASYKTPRTLVWTIGTIIFILMMATAFLGYVLPFGQMSLWGATVITSLMSAIPWVGQDIVEFIWGGFSVNHATLNRFFALHFVLPFALAALALMHLIVLHDKAGSGNPLGVSGNSDRLPFAPYFIFKDLITIFIYILVLSIFVFYLPNVLGDSENYVTANPMQTPSAIVPEWYLLPFYAILRSIPNKLLGVIAMFSAILMLLVMAFADVSRSRGIQFKPLSKIMFFLFVAIFIVLTELGAKHVESPFIEFGQICTIIYFAYFLIIVPYLILFENALSELSLDKCLIDNTVNEHEEKKDTNQTYALAEAFYQNDAQEVIEEKKVPSYPVKIDEQQEGNKYPVRFPAYTIMQSNLFGGHNLFFKNKIKYCNNSYLTKNFHTSSILLFRSGNDDANTNFNIEDNTAIPIEDTVEDDPATTNNITLPEDFQDFRDLHRLNSEIINRSSDLVDEYHENKDNIDHNRMPERIIDKADELMMKAEEVQDGLNNHLKSRLEISHPEITPREREQAIDGLYSEWSSNRQGQVFNRDSRIAFASNSTEKCERINDALLDANRELSQYHDAVRKHNERLEAEDNKDGQIDNKDGQIDNKDEQVDNKDTQTDNQEHENNLPESDLDAPRPWGVYFQDSGTSQMEILVELHDNILFYLITILFGVGWLLVTIINKFGDMSWPLSQRFTSHGTTIEIIWTVTPGIILILIAFPSFKLLYLMDEITDPILVIFGEGHQWYWSYQYIDFTDDEGELLEFDSYLVPETDLQDGGLRMLEVDNRIVIPELTHIRFVVSGADVIHSFACPALGLKCDAYPGRTNQSSLMINRLGTFFGQCSEICGILHSSMPIVFEAVSVEKFVEWVRQQ